MLTQPTLPDDTAARLPVSSGDLATWPLTRFLNHVEGQKGLLDAPALVALYGQWLAQHPGAESSAARFNLGALLQSTGNLTGAEQQYREVIEHNNLPEARYNLALLLERTGRVHEAIVQWQAAAGAAARMPLRLQSLASVVRVARQFGMVGVQHDALVASLALAPNQPDLLAALAALERLAAERPSAGAAQPARPAAAAGAAPAGRCNPVIVVVAVCFNEAPILPFFLDHYIHHVGAHKVVLHDGGSTDGSAEIAARYPEVDFIVSRSEKLDDRDLMRIRNEAWKPYRHDCDWIVVCDVDEFLHHPDFRSALVELKRQGITLPMVEGFNIVSKSLPAFAPGRYLWQDRQTGYPDARYINKNLIFDPAIDINYLLGCHQCQPCGPVRRSEGFVFKNLHMSMLSYPHMIEKSMRSAARLSDWNKQTRAGFHYAIVAQMPRADYNAKFLGSHNVVAPRPQPAWRREGFAELAPLMLALDLDANILELGAAVGLDACTDSGSTEFFAWHVHDSGGRLVSVDPDERRLRHARLELDRWQLLTERVSLASAVADLSQGAFDLLYFNAADHFGDAVDRVLSQRQVLMQFLDVEPRLAPQAVVVVDDGAPLARADGKFCLLAQLLVGRGYTMRQLTDTTLFCREA